MSGHRFDRRATCWALMLGSVCSLGITTASAAGTQPPLTGMWVLTQSDYDDTSALPPYTDEARKIADARKKAVEVDLEVISESGKKCLPMGMPAFMHNEFALEILESPGRITMLNEASPVPRTIYLNRSGPSEGLEPMWNGYSTGRREGSTLVIRTTNLNEVDSPIAFGGGIHAPSTTITERLHMEDDGASLINEITFEDARYLQKPWTKVAHYTRLAEDAELWEYVCEIGAAGWSERYAGENKEKAAQK